MYKNTSGLTGLHVRMLFSTKKNGQTFVRRHYLFQDEISFPRVELEKNRKLRGKDNAQGQICENIFVQNRRYCVFFFKYIALQVKKKCFGQLPVSCAGCFLLSVLWYNFIKQQRRSLILT